MKREENQSDSDTTNTSLEVSKFGDIDSFLVIKPTIKKLILGVHIHSVCLTSILMTFEPTGDMCITVCRCDTCIGTVGHVQQCEKDGKEYVERVPGSEQGFEHLTECEDMVIS